MDGSGHPHTSSSSLTESPPETPVHVDIEKDDGADSPRTAKGDASLQLALVRSGRSAASSPRTADARPAEAGGDSAVEWYPEGGWPAWLVVLGSWLALMASLTPMNMMATFQAYLATHQLADRTSSEVGWIFSVYTSIIFGSGVVIGPCFDKYGPRWLVIPGTVGFVAAIMLLSICTELWHFVLVFGILGGVSSGLLFTPPIAAVGHWFRARRGLATGIAATGGGVGGMIFTPVLQRLLDTVGWEKAMLVLGGAFLALASTGCCLIRSRLPRSHKAGGLPHIRDMLASRPFVFMTIGTFLLQLGLFVPMSFVSLYAIAQGFGESFSFNIIIVVNAASVVGRILPGWCADKVGPYNSIIVTVALAGVACFAVWLPAGSSTAGLVMFALLFGFTSGSTISLTPVCVSRLCPMQHYGEYYAACYSIAAVACLIGIPIAGVILSSSGGWAGLILFTAAAYMGALVFLVAARLSFGPSQLWAKV